METMRCLYDGQEYPIQGFYKASKRGVYKGLGYIPYCKKSLSEIAKNYYSINKNKMLAILYTCMKIDVGFDMEHYEKTVPPNMNVSRSIITYLDSYVKGNEYPTSDETLYSLGIYDLIQDYMLEGAGGNLDDVKMSWTSYQVTDHDIMFWGEGLTQSSYHFLTTTLVEYMESYSFDTPVSRELLKQICLTTLDLRNARKVGGDTKAIDDLTKRLSGLFNDSNIKPNQKRDINDSQESFGTLVEKFETEKPIPDPFSEWERNNIFRELSVWIVGQIQRMHDKPTLQEFDEELDKYTVKPSSDEE